VSIGERAMQALGDLGSPLGARGQQSRDTGGRSRAMCSRRPRSWVT
jgi:hypothetical protein